MKRSVLVVLTVIIAASLMPALVSAKATGGLRIMPFSEDGFPNPIMLTSPATFNISTTNGAPTSYFPHILLVMSDASHNGLTGDVVVEWDTGTVNFAPADFKGEDINSNDVPDSGVTVPYQVATLKSHLGVSDKIWWAWKQFLSGGPVTDDPIEFTVTLPSTSPRMLVLAYGKSVNSDTALFDMRVPPSQPGFVIPEPIPLLMAVGSFAALGLYAIKRKRD